MNNGLPPLFLGGGFVAIVALLIRLGSKAAKEERVRFARLAADLGLTIEPMPTTLGIFRSPPRASGERRGKLVELYTYSTGSGKSRTVWSAVSTRPRIDGGLTFSLTCQGFGSKIAEFFGTKEIQIGDPAFDATWFIQTNRPKFFAAALLPELRAKIAAAMNSRPFGSLKLEQGKVLYAEPGAFFDVGRCVRFAAMADVVGDLADIAEVHGSTAER